MARLTTTPPLFAQRSEAKGGRGAQRRRGFIPPHRNNPQSTPPTTTVPSPFVQPVGAVREPPLILPAGNTVFPAQAGIQKKAKHAVKSPSLEPSPSPSQGEIKRGSQGEGEQARHSRSPPSFPRRREPRTRGQMGAAHHRPPAKIRVIRGPDNPPTTPLATRKGRHVGAVREPPLILPTHPSFPQPPVFPAQAGTQNPGTNGRGAS